MPPPDRPTPGAQADDLSRMRRAPFLPAGGPEAGFPGEAVHRVP